MAVVDFQQYIDRSGGVHQSPTCDIRIKEVVLNSEDIDPSTGDPRPLFEPKQTVCVTHNDRPVYPQESQKK